MSQAFRINCFHYLSVDICAFDNNSGYTIFETSGKVCLVPIVINESSLVKLSIFEALQTLLNIRKGDHAQILDFVRQGEQNPGLKNKS